MPRETGGAPGQTRREISFWGHWRQRRKNSWKARGGQENPMLLTPHVVEDSTVISQSSQV